MKEERAQRIHERHVRRKAEQDRKVTNDCARCGNCELWHGRFFFLRTHGHDITCRRFKEAA